MVQALFHTLDVVKISHSALSNVIMITNSVDVCFTSWHTSFIETEKPMEYWEMIFGGPSTYDILQLLRKEN